MWTEIIRAQYRRDAQRYASDTRREEWAQIAPLLPPPRRLGRPREHDLRAILDAILYLLWTGCQWRALPKDLAHIFAERVYRGEQLRNAIAECGPWTIEVVERPPGVKGFQLLPRRWVSERTFAWLGRSRRLAKDFEATIASATAWAQPANLRLLSRRLARA
jgi:transposase